MNNQLTSVQIKALQQIADTFINSTDNTENVIVAEVKPITVSTKKRPRFENCPIVLGSDFKQLMKISGVTEDDICSNYLTGKGTLIDKAAVSRYKNVTQRDIDGGLAYSKGVPVRFMQWLYAYIAYRYAAA